MSDDDFDDGHGADHEGGGDGAGDHGGFDDPLYFFDKTPKVGSPDTPGRVRPDKRFEMKVFGRSKEMPDGEDVEFWGFEDRLNETEEDVIVPSSPIRVTEGDIVHVTLEAAKRQHTIHLHGIESDTHNDGVGHTSFEVTGDYTYQWRAGAPFRPLNGGAPQTRGAGTYFYHCHVNTVLHFQMGMWGPLIVDPVEGPGTAFHAGPTYDVDAERVWAAGEVDHRWRDLGHQAGLKGGNARLHRFRPRYFHISGEFQPMRRRRTNPQATIDASHVATSGEVGGEPILIRYINAGYTIQTIEFDGLADGRVAVDVIASDGRPFDNVAPNFATPFPLVGPLTTAGAERFDLLVRPLHVGTSVATIRYHDWITGRELGVARTTITGT